MANYKTGTLVDLTAYGDPQVNVNTAINNVAGNVLLVVLRWQESVTVSSVADSKGNTYSLAASNTGGPNGTKQAIYYASNIAAGANSVTATFSGAVSSAAITILEVENVPTSSVLDGTPVGASGSGTINP